MATGISRILFSALLIGVILTLPLPAARAVAPATVQISGAAFVITWLPACATPPAEAITALETAAALWGTWISSPVPIAVSACWTPDPSGGDALATGIPAEYITNFPGAPLVNVNYPIALANALSGADLHPGAVDMRLQFKSDIAWSYTTKMHATAGEDFIAVALHELAHGLGFVGNMVESSNIGFCGDGPYGALYPCPTPYDWFAMDSTGVPLLDYRTPDPRELGARLKSDASFGGANVITAYGSPLKLYTPATWMWGSSLSHLDQSTFGGGSNRLMTPSYSGVTRHPGAATLAAFQDLGWLRAGNLPNLTTSGPLVLGVDQTMPFTGALVWPAYAGQNITYTWKAADLAPITSTGPRITDSATLAWAAPGEKRITLTASGGVTPVSAARSVLVYGVSASGPATGQTDRVYAFDAALTLDAATFPITYTWEATGKTPIVHANAYLTTDATTFSWSAPGAKTITVTVDIKTGVAQATHTLQIAGIVLDKHIYLPLVIRTSPNE